MNSKAKNPRSIGRIIQIVLLALGGFWLLSFLFQRLPVYLQELQIADSVVKAGMTPSGYSPTANFLGALSVPLFFVVFFALGVFPSRWGKWIRISILVLILASIILSLLLV